MSAPWLSYSPTSVEMGSIPTGSPTAFAIEVQAVDIEGGGEDVIITALTVDNADVDWDTIVLPHTVDLGDSLILFGTVTPSGAGLVNTGIAIICNAINGPINIPISFTGVVAPTHSISVAPTAWAFPDTEIGVVSAQKVFVITNNGSGSVTITSITPPTDFEQGGTWPSLPAPLAPAATMSFGIKFGPSTEGAKSGDVSIVSTATGSPKLVPVGGVAITITPVYNLQGSVADLLIAFAFDEDDPTILIEQIPVSFDSEADGLIRKLFNFEQIGVDKLLQYLYIHYEDFGEVDITITLRNFDTDTETVYQSSLGSPEATQKTKLFIQEVIFAGENIEVEIVKAAGDGPLVIVDFLFKWQPEDAMVGVSFIPASITQAYSLSSAVEKVYVAVMASGPIIYELVSDNLSIEAGPVAYFSKKHMLPFQSEQGAIPGFTYEKELARVFFHYEDLGEASVLVTVTTMRDQTSSQLVEIGSVDADEELLVGIADLKVVDEVTKVQFTRVTGAISIVDYTIKYVLKGERAKS